MNEKFLILDTIEGWYLARKGISFGWSLYRRNAACLTEEQAKFWQRQLVLIKRRGGISIQRVTS